ncbi:hypothetical protein CK203_056968 [Vitis vinifera]|uniref:Uncharacterized protein n=1 Tax=Vitis vinifera TaxID=29760 RepID=A0A438GN55_VITVI|nr:hypothetical protein CK203_056968 [Vitis vinifera]
MPLFSIFFLYLAEAETPSACKRWRKSLGRIERPNLGALLIQLQRVQGGSVDLQPEANIQENGPTASPDPSSTRRRFSTWTLNPTTDAKRPGHRTGPAASSGKKQDGSDHVENGLDPELGIRITFRRIIGVV